MKRHSHEIDLGEDAGPSPTHEILRAVSSAVRGGRTDVADLLARARDRIEERVRDGVGQALPRADGTEPIRGAQLGNLRPHPAIPATTSRKHLVALQRVSASNERRAFAAIQHNSRAIDRLAKCQRELGSTLAKLQARGDVALLEGILDGLCRVERRVQATERAVAARVSSLETHAVQETRALRSDLNSQIRASRIDKLTETVGSMQSAAFGTRGRVFAASNLLLAANQLLWAFGGDLLRAFGILGRGESTPLAWLSPVASLVVAQVALGNRQHERFASGISTDFVETGGENAKAFSMLSLEGHIASGLWPRFRRRTSVPVTATLLQPLETGATVNARVENGNLSIMINDIKKGSEPRVAWIVDTEAPGG